MRSTGMVRRVDDLGRIVIPKEKWRYSQNEEGQPLEVFVGSNSITLKKYAPGCVFCGSIEDDMIRLYGKYVCRECRKAIARGE